MKCLSITHRKVSFSERDNRAELCPTIILIVLTFSSDFIVFHSIQEDMLRESGSTLPPEANPNLRERQHSDVETSNTTDLFPGRSFASINFAILIPNSEKCFYNGCQWIVISSQILNPLVV
jgi:hypothetical protein